MKNNLRFRFLNVLLVIILTGFVFSCGQKSGSPEATLIFYFKKAPNKATIDELEKYLRNNGLEIKALSNTNFNQNDDAADAENTSTNKSNISFNKTDFCDKCTHCCLEYNVITPKEKIGNIGYIFKILASIPKPVKDLLFDIKYRLEYLQSNYK